MHIHLDVVGGVSGDMFIGALLDCFPNLYDGLAAQITKAGFSELVKLSCEPADDGILTGTKFNVAPAQNAEGYDHRHYSEIKKIISESKLDPATREIALTIFHYIAVAEASIHGKEVDKVAFHEVGAWDSIADILVAAHLINELDVSSWSSSTLPLGKGQVQTAHGLLPIPAPATSLLLEGFEFYTDDIEGERITPTGAAILKYLAPGRSIGKTGGRLTKSGYGFGTKRFSGISNVLRLLVFDSSTQKQPWFDDQVLQIEFEVDDQTSEELANALEIIRESKGVLDVLQIPAFGKKGRQTASVRILAKPDTESDLIGLCFDTTTTIGVRKQLVSRSILQREEVTINENNSSYRVKIVHRPDGANAKAEMDDFSDTDKNLAAKREIRKRIESVAEQNYRKSHPND